MNNSEVQEEQLMGAHVSGGEKAHTREDFHIQEEEKHGQKHVHVREDGTVYEHVHVHSQQDGSHPHSHAHTHTHTNTKAVLNRLSKAIGHLESIKRMIESGRDCSEVLIQLSAVKSAINNTGKVILQDHIQHCLVDAIASGDMEEIEELNKAIDRFIK